MYIPVSHYKMSSELLKTYFQPFFLSLFLDTCLLCVKLCVMPSKTLQKWLTVPSE